MTRTELIQKAIQGDLESAFRIIYDEDTYGKWTTQFRRFGCYVFQRSDDDMWHAIRDAIFQLITDEDCKLLRQVKEDKSFDGWLYKIVLHYTTTNKQGKKIIMILAGYTNQKELETNQSLDDEEETSCLECGSECDSTNNTLSTNADKLAELYDTRNDVETVHELIRRFKRFATFDGKTTLTYAVIMAKLAIFAKKEIERYGQE